MKKILLVGPYTQDNIGDEAGFLSLVRIFEEGIGKCEFVALARHPSEKFKKDFRIKTIKNLDHASKEKAYGRFFNGFNFGDDTKHLELIKKELETSDLILIGPGRDLHDQGALHGIEKNIAPNFFQGVMSYYAIIVTLAKFFNIPVIIFSESLIPLITDFGTSQLKFLIENSLYCLFREKNSMNILKENNILKNNCHIVGDIAFYLDKTNYKHRSNSILSKHKIPFRDNFISIATATNYLSWDENEFNI